MTKAVFTTKVDPTYDDLPEGHYHFPSTYLNVVKKVLGDMIVYYEPRRTSGDLGSAGGRLSYFAIARVDRIVKDEARRGYYYALVSHYLEFDRPVPFREGEHYFESKLQRADGKTNKGGFGRSVREIPDSEYEDILNFGFGRNLVRRLSLLKGLATELRDAPDSIERSVVEQVVKRPFRDAAFSRQVKAAYGDTCAVTGIKIINGGGRSEVQAAHIRPVKDNGPDSIRNGIALSGTLHWMFDRGLVSIDDDYSILTAKGAIPEPLRSMFNADMRLLTPDNRLLAPHSKFLAYHRENVFKG